MRKRLEPAERKQQIMTAALKLARKHGYMIITREAVAEEAGVSAGLVSLYWGTMPKFRRSIMREAVRTECMPVIAQGLVNGDPIARRAPDDVVSLAIASI